ncbi:MAG: helix-turn-helix domain-containing protein [Bacteroidales bacterium]|nr:helix-turn-helix domain-containing protein [Bacteroidales bacterium]
MQILAEKCLDITYQALYASVSGNPTLERLQQIATALDVPITDLFDKPATGTISCPNCGTEIKLTAEKV